MFAKIKEVKKLNLAILFGAKSPEHEVSIITALQASEWIDRQRYQPYFIYLDRQNQAYLCPKISSSNLAQLIKKTLEQNRRIEFRRKAFLVGRGLLKKIIPIDAALLCFHGSYGEDGRIQGLLDFLEVPYTGSGVLGSALGMDKVATKAIFAKLGLPVTPYLWFYYSQLKQNTKEYLKLIRKRLNYPLFVKPANAGSSVGITKVTKEKQLSEAIKKASRYDQKILIEQSIEGAVDINCAVMGGHRPIASVCEQPISEDQFLSFREKYLKGGKTKGMAGLSRIVPAPIPNKIAAKIQEMAKLIFQEFSCWGMARIDFLYQKKTGKIYPNELNTIPGSLAFYLWKASGIRPEILIDKMISLALKRSRNQARLSYKFKSPILSQFSQK